MKNASFALLAFALGANAKIHTMKAAKKTRKFETDNKRVTRHLHTLLAKAPEKHKAALTKEIDRITTKFTVDVDAWYGYPETLDWIVDIYFSSDDDATAYPVILDSGSSNLAIASSSCSNCGDAATTLDLDLVSDPEMCIDVTYGSGEWFGYEASSTYVGMDSSLAADMTLAAITYQDEFFEGGSSYVGILGMAYDGIANGYSESECSSSTGSSKSSSKGARSGTAATKGSSGSARGNGVRGDSKQQQTQAQAQPKRRLDDSSSTSAVATPFLYALRDAGVITSNTFAVAMCGDDADVSLGGVDEAMYTGDISYATTQMTFGEYYGYYLIYTTGVSVGSTAVTVDDINEYGGLVVDTGTTLHYLPTKTVAAIETEVKAAYSDLSSSFFSWEASVTEDDLSSFPTVTYTFAESSDDDAATFTIELEPEHYLLKYDDGYYWGFESSSLGIFGNIGMKDKLMVFDIENSRIGIATGVCSASDDASSSLIKSPTKMLNEIVGEVSKRSSSELTIGVLSAFAVVGTVIGAAFVVLNKVTTTYEAVPTSEEPTLLPPL